jgi:hypothetical protein
MGSCRPSLLAKQLSRRSIDEMKTAACLADNCLVRALRVVGPDLVRLPLHVHPGQGTFEDEVSHE